MRYTSAHPMPLTPGSKLGPYEIQSSLGAGGMGEVYAARDTRLDRTVAIKILPEHLSEKPEAHARFEREATSAKPDPPTPRSGPNRRPVTKSPSWYFNRNLRKAESFRRAFRPTATGSLTPPPIPAAKRFTSQPFRRLRADGRFRRMVAAIRSGAVTARNYFSPACWTPRRMRWS
jgi:hypothetical protein